MSNPVVTEKQAREIAGGRKPHVPIEYEQACKQLEACRTLDEAKYWDNKADALAAWAKIYRDDTAQRQARALKLWAYRRMGILAGEIRPTKKGGTKIVNGKREGLPGTGSVKLLQESGLNRHQAIAARALARASPEAVQALTELPRPPAPTYATHGRTILPRDKGGGFPPLSDHPQWIRLRDAFNGMTNVCHRTDPVELARSIHIRKSAEMRTRAIALTEWLDKFEQHLPKAKP